MDNDHGITRELRHYIEGAEQLYGRGCQRLTAMCDRIDAELAERYVELPKDADGEPIHIGDVMENGLDQSFTPKKVKMLMLEGDEWMLNFGGGWCAMKHHEWRHHTPDTWERIIKDAMEGADRDGSPDTYQECVAELVARCKALAGGDAE